MPVVIRSYSELFVLQQFSGKVISFLLFCSRKSFIVNMDLVEAHWAKAEGDARRIWIDEDNLQVISNTD